MNEFKTVTFSGFEKQIRDARLVRSAMIGEAIGNAFATVWFSAQRMGAWMKIVISDKYATVKRLRQHIASSQLATPH